MDQLTVADRSEHVVCATIILYNLILGDDVFTIYMQIPGEVPSEVSLPLAKSKETISAVSCHS